MGLLTGLVTWPLAPVRGVAWVAEKVCEETDRELYDPARIRQQLMDIEEARSAGVLDDEEAAEMERELVARLLPPPTDRRSAHGDR